MFWAIERQGISRSFCSMNDTCSFGPSTTWPATLTVPALVLARPEPMLSKVLLPQPDGPMMDTTSPGAMEKLTSRAASTSLRLAARGKALLDADELDRRDTLGRLEAGSFRRPLRP